MNGSLETIHEHSPWHNDEEEGNQSEIEAKKPARQRNFPLAILSAIIVIIFNLVVDGGGNDLAGSYHFADSYYLRGSPSGQPRHKTMAIDDNRQLLLEIDANSDHMELSKDDDSNRQQQRSELRDKILAVAETSSPLCGERRMAATECKEFIDSRILESFTSDDQQVMDENISWMMAQLRDALYWNPLIVKMI